MITPDELQVQSQPFSDETGPTYKDKAGNKYNVGPLEKGQIVVRQVQVDLFNGSMIEVPNTESVQTYYRDQFERMAEEKDGKPSFFSESKIKVEVLTKA